MGKEKKAKKDDDSDEECDNDSESQKDEIDVGELKSVIETLAAFVKSKGSSLSVTDFFDECKVMQATKQYDDKWRMYVALASLFPDGSLDSKNVSTRTKYLQKLKDFGNMSCPDFLWGFETYLAENPSIKGYPMVLKALFDDDMVKEEELLEHYDSEDVDSKGFPDAKRQATPFLEWLRNAEEEGDSDEEEDDDDEDEDD